MLRHLVSSTIASSRVVKGASSCRMFATKSELIKSRVVDHKLVKFLKYKIMKTNHSNSNKSMPILPADFPFTIQDYPCKSFITLTNQLIDDGEKIEVELFLMGDHAEYVQLCVNILKENGKDMEFLIIVSADNIEIKHVKVDKQQIWLYDNDLVAAYIEFLEIRGIRKCYFGLLHDLAIGKDIRHRISYIKELKNFIKEQ